jgi:hypothetical protein
MQLVSPVQLTGQQLQRVVDEVGQSLTQGERSIAPNISLEMPVEVGRFPQLLRIE